MNSAYLPLIIEEETLSCDAVRRYKDLYLEEIAKLASELCCTPIAHITLVDETRRDFIVKTGLDN